MELLGHSVGLTVIPETWLTRLVERDPHDVDFRKVRLTEKFPGGIMEVKKYNLFCSPYSSTGA
jgi:hypothetical protein